VAGIYFLASIEVLGSDKFFQKMDVGTCFPVQSLKTPENLPKPAKRPRLNIKKRNERKEK
jgi:hypothetical protein